MIEVKATNVGYSVSFGLTTWCPACDHQMSFLHISPQYCEICHSELPNIPALLDAVMDRVAYYRSGKALEESRRLRADTIQKHVVNGAQPFRVMD